MIYNVFGGTLNLTLSLSVLVKCLARKACRQHWISGLMMWKIDKGKIIRAALCCNNCITQLCTIVYTLVLTVVTGVPAPVGSEFRFYVYQPVISR